MGTPLRIQDLLLSLATQFIDPDIERLDQIIEQALADVGQLVGVDRAYLMSYDWSAPTATHTHAWCAPGAAPHQSLMQEVPLADYSDWISVHARGDIICVDDVAALPMSGLKRLLERMGIRSVLALPLMDGGSCIGCMGFDGTRRSVPQTPDQISLLGQFGRLLVDVRRKQRADLALQAQRDTLQLILDHAPIGIWLQNGTGKVTFVNKAFCAAMGISEDEFKAATHYAELIPSEFRAQCLASDEKALSSHGIAQAHERLPFSDGRVHDLQVIKVVKRDASGQPEFLVGLSMDITDQLARQQALLASEERLRMALAAAKQAWFEVDVRTGQVTLSPEYAQLIGHDLLAPQTSDMAHWQSQVHPDDAAQAMSVFQQVVREGGPLSTDYRRATTKGGWKWLRSVGKVAERDAAGQPLRVVGIHTDIQQLKASELQLHRMAHFDALTALPNRALLADRLQQAMAQARRHGQRLAVLYIDLDGFKGVNDTHGHDAGDRYLQLLAEHLRASLREGDTMGRLGGDEFVAVLLNVPDLDACVPVLSRLLAAARQAPWESGPPLAVSASIGLTFYPQAEPVDGDQLLRQADQAMYQAKLGGKNRFAVYDSAQAQEIQQKHQTLDRLQAALDNNELVLHFQPQVNMRSGTVVGAEALVRWQHPERGLLLPGEFLPVLHGSSLATRVGEWVIASALKQQLLWRNTGLDVPVSVNVDAQQLQHPLFVQSLTDLLAKHAAIRPGDLHLEIVESNELHDIDQASHTMAECAAMGVAFALDDFGTGYASLTYLRRLPAQLIKIDQSFVRDMLTDPEDMALMRGAIGLASAFNRRVIAEGVETTDQASALMNMGCDWGQGYGIARPMPGDALPTWASIWQSRPAPDSTR